MFPFTTSLFSGPRRPLLLTNVSIRQNKDEGPAWNSAVLKVAQAPRPSMDESPHPHEPLEESKIHPLPAPCMLHSGRFLTLHKRRKKKPPTRAIKSEQALLDDLYHGPIHSLLDRINEWPFNAFALDRATGGRPLPTLCFHLFHHYGLMAHFSLDPVKAWKFFSLVEEGYHSSNPYHNSIHAADVTQAMHCFLQENKMRLNMSPLEVASSLIAAMAHDLDHPGVNQPFLVATSNHLASLYKNASVLENHHWRSAMACLVESGMMDTLDRQSSRELQHQIQSLILATDIARQHEFLTAFKNYLDNDSLDVRMREHRHFMLQIALKCADISNPCRPWEMSRAWSLQVSEEFYRQGDLERRLGLPVTPLCDRYASSVSKIQTGFFRFIAAPLFEEWHRFQQTKLSFTMLKYLRSNQLKWDSMLNDEACGVPAPVERLQDLHWSELGILESGVEKIQLRRASLPPGRSGMWSSESHISASLLPVVDDNITDAVQSIPDRAFRNRQPKATSEEEEEEDDTEGDIHTEVDSEATENFRMQNANVRLAYRRESLPFNFPDRSVKELRMGRRESLPAKVAKGQRYSRTLSADDILPELNITSMAPFARPLTPSKKEKKTTSFAPNCVNNITTSVPSSSASSANTSSSTSSANTSSSASSSFRKDFARADEKENLVANGNNFKLNAPRLTLRRGSAPTALHPVNWQLDCNRSKRPAVHLGRHGSLRLSKYDHNAPDFRRRGSLPYELGSRKTPLLTANELSMDSARAPLLADRSKNPDLGSRRGSAPSDLLRNTSASIASCWIQFRDRIKVKGKELVLGTGTGFVGDSGCGFAVRERRRHSLRRRRSGGPELFACAARRGSTAPPPPHSAQLPPLPQSATCSHAKLKRTNSLTPPSPAPPPNENVKTSLVGYGDAERDWLLLGRRGSGALELLASLWRQNSNRSERSSFDSDDSILKFHLKRASIDSSASSDGLLYPHSAEDYCHFIEHRRSQRRGSCPTYHSSIGSCSVNWEFSGR